MKAYMNPSAIIVKLTALDVLNGSWNASDSDDLAANDLTVNVNDMGW